MIKCDDPIKLKYYIEKFQIIELFTEDPTDKMDLYYFKKGEYICREEEKMRYLYFFVSGSAKVYSVLSNGKSLLLAFYDGFRMLGDVELFGKQTASSNVEVIKDSYCLGIPMDYAKNVLVSDNKFLQFVCKTLGDKLNRSSKNSSINLLYPLENRLSSYIYAMVSDRVTDSGYFSGQSTKISQSNRSDNETPKFSGNLTEIAELLGTSYRHLLRTLNALVAKSILEKEKNCYRVIDLEQLEKLAADLYR